MVNKNIDSNSGDSAETTNDVTSSTAAGDNTPGDNAADQTATSGDNTPGDSVVEETATSGDVGAHANVSGTEPASDEQTDTDTDTDADTGAATDADTDASDAQAEDANSAESVVDAALPGAAESDADFADKVAGLTGEGATDADASAAQPASSEPSQPAASEPAVAEPAVSEPAVSEPGASEPAVSEPEPAVAAPFVSAPSTVLVFRAPPVLPQRADDSDDDRGWSNNRSGSSTRDDRRSRADQGRGSGADRGDRYSRDDRPERGDRNDRPGRNDRADRNDRDRNDRNDREDDDRDFRDERDDETESTSARRRNRRRSGEEDRATGNEPANTVVKVRQPREPELITEPQRIKGSTRLEAKKQRRRDGRDAGRRRTVVTEAEFLARRESVDRKMIVRSKQSRIQIGVLEDGVLVEHYVARNQDASLIGNVYLGRVQNVLPSMEAAFVDIGRGRNAVLYSGEVDWDAAETGNQPRRIELALKPGDRVLVQVTKDPVGHKGARLTSQVSLPGRYLVYVPNGSMNGISRKLPDTERARLKKILKEVLPDNNGVIVRTAAEGATEEQLTLDVNRLINQWAEISRQVESVQAPALLHSEPDLLIKIVRDVFNEDFEKMVIDGEDAREVIESYLRGVAPDLLERVERYEGQKDSFDEYRISEQIEKALDRKVWLPSGGSLVIDRTEAMTVVDVNTGKFVGSGGNLEETVTKNNLEAAEEIVRQLRLRDIGGIIVVDFIDMVLENNRDLVLRRMVECLSRDRTKHQVAEVTSLGLVQMTRKKLGLGLLESFSEPCETCAGRGVIVHHEPVFKHRQQQQTPQPERRRGGKGNNGSSNGNGNGNGFSNGNGNGNGNGSGQNGNGSGQNGSGSSTSQAAKAAHAITDDAKNALAQIAASTLAAHGISGDDVQTNAVDAAVAEASDTLAGSAPVSPSDEAPDASAPESPRKKRSRNKRDKQQGDRGPRQNRSDESSEAPTAESAGNDERATVRDSEKGQGSARNDRDAQRQSERQNERQNERRSDAQAESQTDRGSASAAPSTGGEATRILDLPIVPTEVERPARRNADDLLGSVLDALPEPKQPGQGRSKRRRVTTAALQGTPVRHEPTPVRPDAAE